MTKSTTFRALTLCVGLVFASTNAVSAMCAGTFIPTPPIGTLSNSLLGAALISPNDIWAVGKVSAAGGGLGTSIVAEHWNGSKWTVIQVAQPMPGPDVANAFEAIAAIQSNDVWAVGTTGADYGPSPLIEHWDGVAWSVIPSQMPGYEGVLNAISATSATNVWAAGSYTVFGGATHAFVELWTGSAWTAIADPETTPILSISARSSNDVWAADGDGVDHWDGSAWSVVSNLSAISISAVAPNDVWIIVGPSTIEHWNGSDWTVVPSPQVDHLQSITANSADNAWAVGQSHNAPLTEHWNGSTWSIEASPSDGSSSLAAIALNGDGAFAVGSTAGGLYNRSEEFKEIWNGSRWKAGPEILNQSMPNAFGAAFASTTTDAWAGGYLAQPIYTNDAIGLLEHWNGSKWSRFAIPRRTEDLEDFGGLSPSDVWAVGFGGDSCSYYGQAAVIHWDGRQWAYVSPNVCAGINSNLTSVAVVKPNDVWAVGEDDEPGPVGSEVIHELAINWTGGKRWTTYSMPDDPYAGGLASIRAVAANDIWAVGAGVKSGGRSYDLIYHFDGSSWSDLKIKNPERHGGLSGLGVVNADDIWAVGGQANSNSEPAQPLIMHWDGVSWKSVPHANAPPGSYLYAVEAVLTNDVWAIGYGPEFGSHVEHWNGSVWSTIPATFAGTLMGLSVIPKTRSVWAVGRYQSIPLGDQSLASIFHC